VFYEYRFPAEVLFVFSPCHGKIAVGRGTVLQSKIFAMIGLGSVPQTMVCKCNPESFAALTELEGIVPAPYVGRYQWVMLERLDALSDFELRHVITSSYDLVAAKFKVRKSRQRRSNPVKPGS